MSNARSNVSLDVNVRLFRVRAEEHSEILKPTQTEPADAEFEVLCVLSAGLRDLS
jgi:hypothetical protein